MPAAITQSNIVDYLASKNVRTWRASGPEVTAHCFFCGRHNRDKGRLYINTEEGVYFCQVCCASGTLKDILEHFGDPPETAVASGGVGYLSRRRLLNGAAEIAHETLLAREDVLEWLMGNDRTKKQRGLSVDTIERAKIGFLAKNWSLTKTIKVPHDRAELVGTGLVYPDGREFFEGPKVIIPYVASGGVVQIRGRDWPEGKYRTGPGENVRLYGADDLRGSEDAIVVEGEFDREVLKQLLLLCPDERLRRTAVVGIPGAGAFPSEWADYFRGCRRVFVACDPDDAGKAGNIRVKDALGSKARIVELPDDLPKCDWTEYLVYRGHGWKDVRSLLDTANNVGRRLFFFSEAHESWKTKKEAGEVYPTGFADLDATIDGGGLTPGSVTVIAAKTGAGKTLLAGNIVVNHMRLNLNVPTLFVSMEMVKEELAERFDRQWRFWYPDHDDEEMRAAFDKQLLICDENQLANRDIDTLVSEYIEEMADAPKLIFVDHLQYLSRQQRGKDSYERTTGAIQSMKGLAKDAGASVVVLSQVNRIAKDGQPIDADTMRDSGAVEETADYLITAWRPDDALEPGSQLERTGAIQAALPKNRRGPKGQRFKLQTALASLVICDTGGAAAFKAVQENKQVWSGKTYADIYGTSVQRQLAVVT